MAKRVNLKTLNKRSFEALAKAGAFDGFEEAHRAQYFYSEENESTYFLEKILRHGAVYQEQQKSAQVSLFGDTEVFEVHDPQFPECEKWTLPVQLKYEKEVTGFYISGHPLDDFSQTMRRFCNIPIDELRNNLIQQNGREVKFAGMITESAQRISKRGDPFGTFVIEDFSGNMSLTLFSEIYLKKKHLLEAGSNIYIIGRVEERRFQPGNYQLVISDIYLLSETMEKLAKAIILDLNASEITEKMSDEIIELAKSHIGSTPLKIRLNDRESRLSITLRSGNSKVDPRMFLKSIAQNGNFRYSIV